MEKEKVYLPQVTAAFEQGVFLGMFGVLIAPLSRVHPARQRLLKLEVDMKQLIEAYGSEALPPALLSNAFIEILQACSTTRERVLQDTLQGLATTFPQVDRETISLDLSALQACIMEDRLVVEEIAELPDMIRRYQIVRQKSLRVRTTQRAFSNGRLAGRRIARRYLSELKWWRDKR